MVGRASSPVLVGRDLELDALREAVAQAVEGPRRVILVEGEAGIGKSRLLAEFASTLERRDTFQKPPRVVFGHAVQLTEGSLPFGPVIEVLDALARGIDPPGSHHVTRLRDELSGAGASARPSSRADRGRLFLDVHGTLQELAGDRPLVLVLDDLHWADRSTLDLIVYLASRMRATRLILVLAYRSDELDRRHPLKPVLAELQRGRTIDRITLQPLNSGATTDQIHAIAGEDLDPGFVQRVVQLADGNPFHVEELVALGGPSSALPASLRDVLLARIERLDPDTRSLVRQAAVIGREVDETLLCASIAQPKEHVLESLRSAVERSVLAPSEDGLRYWFRHALLREAVYEDILPADRVALHRTVADLLAGDTGLASRSPVAAAAELARHRDAGQQHDLAREAYVATGQLAMRARAWAEAAAAFERVLEIDAGRNAELRPPDVRFIREVTRALAYAGRPHQGAELLHAALVRATADVDPLEVADGWSDLGDLRLDIGDDEGSREAFVRARAIAPKRPFNGARLRAMGSLVLTRMNDAEYRAAIRLGNCIIAMAETIDAEEVIARTRTRRGPSLLSLGLKTAGLDDLEAARMIATSTGNLDVLGTALINAGANISDVGAFEEGLERIRQASAVSVELGLEGTWDRWLVGSAAQCAYWLGRWDEADHYLARAQSLELHGLPLAVSACVTASLAAHRRDDAGAIRAISEASDASPDVGYLAGLWRAVRAHTCLLRRDLEAAISAVDEGFDVLVGSDDLSNRAFLASLGAEAAADLAQRALARRDKAAAQSWAERASTYAGTAADLAAGRLVRGSVGTPLTRAHDASARAHAQRASGSTDPSVWETAIATYESIGAQPAAEWARYRLAEASLVLGDRESARAALRTAKDRASVIGDLALLAAIEVLARRGRVLLEASSTGRSSSVTEPPAPPNPWNLSNRETEVLGLVAEGLTNREIARQLFITEKTASSHVTHILDKLAVTSRTEAALLAARSGVLFMSGATLHATPEPNLAVHPSQD